MLKKFLLITVVLTLAACSSGSRQGTIASNDAQQLDTLISQLKTNKPHQSSLISNKRLSKVYQEWVGTNYRFGGTTKQGIDCSAFMQETFLSAFGIDLPRSTSDQQSIGKRIQRNELKQGDLVFFRKNRHVGVYIGNNRFMHASTSQGVTINSLSEDYWTRNYTQSRRVF